MGRSFWDQKAILPWPLAPGPGRGPAHSGHHNKLETATYMRIHMEAYRYSRLEAGQGWTPKTLVRPYRLARGWGPY
jgi:hypothetical protein